MKVKHLIPAVVAVCVSAFLASASAAQDSVAVTSKDTLFKTVTAGKFTFGYKVDGKNLSAVISYPTTGWVAVGFNPSEMMKDANFIMGALVDGKTVASDEFGVNEVSHKPDTLIGGKYNILAAECKQAKGVTTFSFTIPLDSGDPKDVKLVLGSKVKVIFAAGKTNDFRKQHNDIAKTTITLQ